MDKEDWHSLLFFMLSHHKPERLHRTIHIGFRGRHVYLCARCTGIYAGILSVLLAWFSGYFNLSEWLYLPLFSILPAPSIIDWLTQSCKVRESKNVIRTGTGYLLGISGGFFFLMLIRGMFYLFFQALAVLGGYILLIYVVAWKTRFLDTYFD